MSFKRFPFITAALAAHDAYVATLDNRLKWLTGEAVAGRPADPQRPRKVWLATLLRDVGELTAPGGAWHGVEHMVAHDDFMDALLDAAQKHPVEPRYKKLYEVELDKLRDWNESIEENATALLFLLRSPRLLSELDGVDYTGAVAGSILRPGPVEKLEFMARLMARLNESKAGQAFLDECMLAPVSSPLPLFHPERFRNLLKEFHGGDARPRPPSGGAPTEKPALNIEDYRFAGEAALQWFALLAKDMVTELGKALVKQRITLSYYYDLVAEVELVVYPVAVRVYFKESVSVTVDVTETYIRPIATTIATKGTRIAVWLTYMYSCFKVGEALGKLVQDRNGAALDLLFNAFAAFKDAVDVWDSFEVVNLSASNTVSTLGRVAAFAGVVVSSAEAVRALQSAYKSAYINDHSVTTGHVMQATGHAMAAGASAYVLFAGASLGPVGLLVAAGGLLVIGGGYLLIRYTQDHPLETFADLSMFGDSRFEDPTPHPDHLAWRFSWKAPGKPLPEFLVDRQLMAFHSIVNRLGVKIFKRTDSPTGKTRLQFNLEPVPPLPMETRLEVVQLVQPDKTDRKAIEERPVANIIVPTRDASHPNDAWAWVESGGAVGASAYSFYADVAGNVADNDWFEVRATLPYGFKFDFTGRLPELRISFCERATWSEILRVNP